MQWQNRVCTESTTQRNSWLGGGGGKTRSNANEASENETALTQRWKSRRRSTPPLCLYLSFTAQTLSAVPQGYLSGVVTVKNLIHPTSAFSCEASPHSKKTIRFSNALFADKRLFETSRNAILHHLRRPCRLHDLRFRC